MADLPISSLPAATTGYSDSLMVIVNYDVVSTGRTESIPFSAITGSTIGTSGTSGVDGTNGSSGTSGVDGVRGTSGTSGSSGTSPVLPFPTVFGLFAQTGNSTAVSATTVETTIIDGGVGTLSVSANTFSIGDSFRADMAGILNAANNETIRVRVKSGSIVLLDSGPQILPAVTNDVWTMSINFTIRQIGGTGVASIVSLGAFHYTKLSTGNVEGFSFNTVNNTTFDTTIDNTLDVTVEWGSNNTSNSIYSDIFVLNKIY